MSEHAEVLSSSSVNVTVNGPVTAPGPLHDANVPGAYDVVFGKDGAPERLVYQGQRRKVACVGFAETTKGETPYLDASYEVWSLNQHYRYMPRASRWFEIHQRKDYLADQVEGTDYLAWLKACPIPVYVTDPHSEDLPTAIQFPFDKYKALAGIWEDDGSGRYALRDYTQSSLVYMLALALIEDFDVIETYGVDLVVGQEYGFQKPNMEWLFGVAQGRGYEITRGKARGAKKEIVIPTRSALLRQTYSYGPQLYPKTHVMKRIYEDRLAVLLAAKDQLLAQLHGCDGAINDTQQFLAIYDMHEKGGDVIWKFKDGHLEHISPV